MIYHSRLASIVIARSEVAGRIPRAKIEADIPGALPCVTDNKHS